MNDSTATISKIWARTERLQRWRSATVSLSCYCSRSKKAARQQCKSKIWNIDRHRWWEGNGIGF